MSPSAIGRHVATGDLRIELPGIYVVTAVPSSFKQKVKAATEWSGPGSAAATRTAAAMHDLQGFSEGPIEVISDRNLRSGRVTVRRWALEATDVTKVDGIRTTNVHRTLADLGAVANEEIVETALYAALCRRVTAIPRLQQQLRRTGGHGHKGTATLRKLLEHAEGKPYLQSVLEIKFERLARRSRLPIPIRQHPVRREGRLVYIDFYYPQANLAIEAQSYKFHASPRPWAKDYGKHNLLVAAGFRVHYITWEDVTKRPRQTIAEIRSLLTPTLI